MVYKLHSKLLSVVQKAGFFRSCEHIQESTEQNLDKNAVNLQDASSQTVFQGGAGLQTETACALGPRECFWFLLTISRLLGCARCSIGCFTAITEKLLQQENVVSMIYARMSLRTINMKSHTGFVALAFDCSVNGWDVPAQA